MNNFIFENKTKVYFGKGGVKEYLGSLLRNYGDTVMLAYGGGSIKRNGVYDEVMGILNAAGKRVIEFGGIMSNPTYAKVQEGAKLARENQVDLILAVGGGSVSDCCKVISAQVNADEDLWELENTKHTIPTQFIPLGTIVTVFGTGSEMNSGAVITHEEKKIKGALWGAQADFAFLDPDYTMSVPMKQVISGAFDTLSHAMETYFGKPEENNLSDEMNEAVQRSVIQNIRILLTDPQNYDARSELAWASAMAENGILKIGKITDFQCHMLEHQLGAYTNCNHGAGLAVLHPVLYYSEGLSSGRPTGECCWSYHGESLPFTPYKIRKFNMLSLLWKAKEFNLLKINTGKEVVPESVIPIENLKIPILMFSTKVDTVWPSTESCEILCRRLESSSYSHPYQHIAFDHMSHMMLEYCGAEIKYFIKSEKENPEACYAERSVMGEKTITWIKDIWGC